MLRVRTLHPKDTPPGELTGLAAKQCFPFSREDFFFLKKRIGKAGLAYLEVTKPKALESCSSSCNHWTIS